MSTRLVGPYDGQMVTYGFGRNPSLSGGVKSRTLLEAVRIWRATTLRPDTVPTMEDGLIPVYAAAARTDTPHGGWSWKEVARIPVEDPETEPSDRLLTQMADTMADAGVGGLTRASEAPQSSAYQLVPRSTLTRQHQELSLREAALNLQIAKLQEDMRAMKEEMKRRGEKLWLLGTYLGTSVYVKTLREGRPAPVDTPISVRQRVLCMDEEIAVHRCLSGDPLDGEKAFDNRNLPDFDTWIATATGALDAIFPWPKGVCALRVRRHRKERDSQGDLAIAMANAEEALLDTMTYLLVRNGDALYRVSLDADLWPRLLPSVEDAGPLGGGEEEYRTRWAQEDAAKRTKQQFAGLMAIQGLLAHTEILAPLPYSLDVMNPYHAGAFNLVRDDEGLGMLEDGSDPLRRVTWDAYEKWFQSQVTVGSAVWYIGPQYDRKDGDKISSRVPAVYSDRGLPWPSSKEVYTVTEHNGPANRPGRTWYSQDGAFLYLPADETLRPGEDGWMEWQKRQRRVRFGFLYYEVVPIHALSWRILRHILMDRGQRVHYSRSFPLIQRYYLHMRALAQQEAPFVNLVLASAGWDPYETSPAVEAARARIERLVRWWKVKVKDHRTLSDDEPKALRMILAAFRRGEDHADDPEVAFLATTGE